MASHSGLEVFLSHRRLAFIGVSASPTCPTRELFRRLIARGHELAPIRPGVSDIEGIKAYPNLLRAGDVDGVVIMTSRRTAERALEECLDAGARQVWLIGEDVGGGIAAFAAEHGIGLLQRLTVRLRRITINSRVTI